ncbi:MAG: hypothetical protein HC831_02790 [Chloroflexia bacterium]|nr:hypothetical protein [Chloroflexia bacterium]
MIRSILKYFLVIIIMTFISCDKSDDNQDTANLIDYVIVGDTTNNVSVWHQINIIIKGNRIGDKDTYSYLDSASLDFNGDSIKDFTIRYCLYSTRAPGCTCMPNGRINIWITNESKGCIISDSVKNAAIGLSMKDSVNIYNNLWHSNDSIAVSSEGDLAVRPNNLFDWNTKKFICFKIIDKLGIKQVGWVRIVRLHDSLLIRDFAISKK